MSEIMDAAVKSVIQETTNGISIGENEPNWHVLNYYHGYTFER